VSPNPSEGKYSIGIPEGFEPSQYEVLNSNGNSIQKGNIISVKTFRVDITNMPSGIYLLRLTDRYGRREVVKLMKD
jgi:hypothetical protein